MLRIPLFVAVLVVAAVTLVARLQWTAWPLENLTNFPVQYLIAGMALTILAAILRAPVSAVIAAIVVLVNGFAVGATLGTEARPAGAGARVTLGHLNAQTREIDTVAFGGWLAENRPSVFVVLDPLQHDVAGIERAAPGYRVQTTGSRHGVRADFIRTVVLSRIPLTGVDHPTDPAFGASAVEMTIPTPDGPIDAVAFGTESPTSPSRAHHRDQALNAAARWSRAHRSRRIVMGDFNATPWSPSFERLLHDGRLGNSLDGFGLQVSWPESNVLVRIPIDHALLGPSLAATARGTGPSFGSQHRALRVTVAPRRTAPR